jgi:hypothetical protein
MVVDVAHNSLLLLTPACFLFPRFGGDILGLFGIQVKY